MTKDEALKMAIDALEQAEKQLKKYWNADIKRGYDIEEMDDTPILLCKDTINACKEALEQPAQEPVAWMYENHNIKKYQEHRDASLVLQYGYQEIPLYPHSTLDSTPAHQDGTSPSEARDKEFVTLTDDEIHNVADTIDNIEYACEYINVIDFACAIEQELKTKNGFSDVKEKNT